MSTTILIETLEEKIRELQSSNDPLAAQQIEQIQEKINYLKHIDINGVPDKTCNEPKVISEPMINFPIDNNTNNE